MIFDVLLQHKVLDDMWKFDVSDQYIKIEISYWLSRGYHITIKVSGSIWRI